MEYTFGTGTPYRGPGAPRGPGPDSPPNSQTSSVTTGARWLSKSGALCYHGVYVHHGYTISGPRGPQGPRARLSPQTHRVSEQASVQGLLQVYPIMEYTFTTGTPYLGPGAPKGPGPKLSTWILQLTNLQTYKLTNLQTGKLTNLQTYKLTNLQTYKLTNLQSW